MYNTDKTNDNMVIVITNLLINILETLKPSHSHDNNSATAVKRKYIHSILLRLTTDYRIIIVFYKATVPNLSMVPSCEYHKEHDKNELYFSLIADFNHFIEHLINKLQNCS